MTLLDHSQSKHYINYNPDETLSLSSTYHSVGASRLSNNLTVPSPHPAMMRDLPDISEARHVTQLSAPVGISL